MNKEEILRKLAAGELQVEAASQMLAQIEQPRSISLTKSVSS
jgi:hypothetical protein